MVLCTDLRCYNKYGGSDTTNHVPLRFSLFSVIPPFQKPCGAVYPRNTSQCPHEDGGAKAGRGTPAFPNCVHRGALSPQCREGTRKSVHRSRERSPKPEEWARLVPMRKGQQRKNTCAVKRIHNQPAARTSDCACKTITKGGVNLPFRV